MKNTRRTGPKLGEGEKKDGTHGFSIESILDPKASSNASAFNLTMRIKFKTELGE